MLWEASVCAPQHSERCSATYWCHHFFIKGEGDVGTVVLVVRIRIAFGLHGLLIRRPTFPHCSTGVSETAVVFNRNTGMSSRAFVMTFGMYDTRSRTAPNLGENKYRWVTTGYRTEDGRTQNTAQLYLRTGDFSVQTLTGITVIIPLRPIWHYSNTGNARPSCNWREIEQNCKLKIGKKKREKAPFLSSSKLSAKLASSIKILALKQQITPPKNPIQPRTSQPAIIQILLQVLWPAMTPGIPSWHPGPLRPGGQMQRYPLISSTHVAPKAQGEDWHSLISRVGKRK